MEAVPRHRYTLVTGSSIPSLPLVPPLMHAPNSQSSFSADAVPSVQLPLETLPSGLEEAVQKLRQRPTDELRRARRHHRRALKALRGGAYESLPEDTREGLMKRLHMNLKALNKALDPDESDADSSSQSRRPASSLFHKALTWLW